MALIKFNYFSKLRKKQSNVTIILPTDGVPEYHADTTILKEGMKYQTLWLLHGGGGDDTDFVNFSNIVRYADKHKIAVVMPSGESFYQGLDYQVLTEELPLVLRTLFPLSDKKCDNFIGGLSHGGDAAMKVCFEYPDRYAAGLVMSAAGTDHHGEMDQVKKRFDVFGLAERNLASGKELPTIIFATGSGDRGFPYYLPIIEKLEEMGMPVVRHFVDGEGHSWDFWDHTLCTALDNMLPILHGVIG